jgi:hypothetical protein
LTRPLVRQIFSRWSLLGPGLDHVVAFGHRRRQLPPRPGILRRPLVRLDRRDYRSGSFVVAVSGTLSRSGLRSVLPLQFFQLLLSSRNPVFVEVGSVADRFVPAFPAVVYDPLVPLIRHDPAKSQ